MIASTANPRLWRVEFEQIHSPTSKSGIVCYIYAVESGLRIFYSHNTGYMREVPKGPWFRTAVLRQPLNTLLRGTIEAGVFMEVWNRVRNDEPVRAWEGDIDGSVEGVDIGV